MKDKLIKELEEAKLQTSKEWLDGFNKGIDRAIELTEANREEELNYQLSKKVDQAYKDGYEKGKGVATKKHRKPKPVIPQFVAEHIKKWKNSNVSLSYAMTTLEKELTLFRGDDEKVKLWLYDSIKGFKNQELYARAWLDGYTVEEEQEYYALIKGHEYIGSDDKYWNYNTEIRGLEIGDNQVHPDVSAEYITRATKDGWADLGINDDNADFVKVEGMEEEQKYYVRDERQIFLLAKIEDEVLSVAKIIEEHGHQDVKINYQLTEQEIKDYDPKYWAFRKPVEEMEE